MPDFEHSIGLENHVENGNANQFNSRASPASFGNYHLGELPSQNYRMKKAVTVRMRHNRAVARPMAAAQPWIAKRVMLAKTVWSQKWSRRLPPALLFLHQFCLLSLPQDELSLLDTWFLISSPLAHHTKTISTLWELDLLRNEGL
jgi:hypothetical protein